MDSIAAPETVTPPAPAPGLTAQEIEALIERKAQEISDKRVSGLQSLYDKKLAEQAKEYQKLRSQLLPGDVDEPEDDTANLRIQELERQLAIERASSKYPKAGPLYKKLLEYEDPEEQIAFMEQLFTPAPAAAPEPPPPQPEVEVPSVDPNSPAQNLSRGTYPSPDGGTVFSDEEAERFIAMRQAEWERRYSG